MKYLIYFAFLLFVLTLPVLFISTTINRVVNNESFYVREFNKYNIAFSTGFDTPELRRIVGGLRAYFNSRQEYLDIKIRRGNETVDLFNDREKQHMKDVKSLINFSYRSQWLSILYIATFCTTIILWRKGRWRSSVYKLVGAGCAATLLFMVLVTGFILVNFQGFFLGFHLLSFSNDLWILDPAREYLIRLFPEGFFFDAALFIGLVVTAESIIIGGLMVWLLYFKPKLQTSRTKS